MYRVYRHTAPNGKVYIGITKQDPERRWQNGCGYKQNKLFSRAIAKHGWDNIKHEILHCNYEREQQAEAHRPVQQEDPMRRNRRGFQLLA